MINVLLYNIVSVWPVLNRQTLKHILENKIKNYKARSQLGFALFYNFLL